MLHSGMDKSVSVLTVIKKGVEVLKVHVMYPVQGMLPTCVGGVRDTLYTLLAFMVYI